MTARHGYGDSAECPMEPDRWTLPTPDRVRLPVVMCVSETGLVMAVADEMALVSMRGTVRQVPLTVVSSLGVAVVPGDIVLVHTGLAVAVLTPQEAAEHCAFLIEGALHQHS